MHQRWARLLFLHWPIDADLVARLVPAPLEIDTFHGQAYIGLVAFTMTGVRPRWSPAVPGLSSFHEVNVRTYVRCPARESGVWFFSLDAANRLAVWIARTFWHLPYHNATMSLVLNGDARTIRYASKRKNVHVRAGCAIEYQTDGSPTPALSGTLEHFLVERYVLYCQRAGATYSGRVHHQPYPLQAANILSWNEDLIEAAGIMRPNSKPLAHYASEVIVKVAALERVVS